MRSKINTTQEAHSTSGDCGWRSFMHRRHGLNRTSYSIAGAEAKRRLALGIQRRKFRQRSKSCIPRM